MSECCGSDRTGKFCNECGKPLASWGPCVLQLVCCAFSGRRQKERKHETADEADARVNQGDGCIAWVERMMKLEAEHEER